MKSSVAATAHPNQRPQSLYSVFDGLPFGITIVKGPSLLIDYINNYNLHLWQRTKEEVLHQPLFEAIPQLRAATEPAHTQAYHTGQRIDAKAVPIQLATDAKNGLRYFDVTIEPLQSEEGDVIGQTVTTIEVTEAVHTRTKVEESQQQAFQFLKQAPVALTVYEGEEFVVSVANKTTLEIWGKTEEELVGKSVFALFPELKASGAYNGALEVLRTGIPFTAKELPISFSRNGQPYTGYFDVVYTAWRDQGGSIKGVITVGTDVTESVIARKKVEESEARFRSTFENAAIGVAHIGLDGGWLFVNNRLANMMGYTKAELERLSVHHISQPTDLEADLHYLQQLLAGTITTYTMEKRYIRKDGSLFWGGLTVSLVRDEAGAPQHFVSIVQDISERKKIEEALQESKERLQASLDASLTGTFRWNIQTNELTWDENLDRLFGLPPGGTVQNLQNFIEHVHPDDRQGVIDRCRRCAEEGVDFDMEFRVVWPDGSLHWLDDKGKTYKDGEGKPLYMAGACVDVTADRIANDKLRESESKFRHLIQSNIIGILFWDLNGSVLDANEAFLKLLGYTQTDLANGLDWRAITPPQWVERDRQAIEELLATGQHLPFEKQYLHRDGHPVDVIVGSSAFSDAGNRRGVTFVLDISQRKKAEAALRENEAQFRDFSNNIQNLAWITNGEGWIYWYNQRWYDYTGTTLEEMQGWGWEKVHHPEHIGRVVAFVKEAWGRDEPWELTFPLRGADGVYRWFLTRAVPIKNEQGVIYRWIGTNTNIDDQVKAQETIRENAKELQRIFSQAPVSMVVYKGKALEVQVASQKALELWGKTAADVMGRPFFDISPELREGQRLLFEQVWQTGEPFVGKEFPVRYRRNGEWHSIYYDFVYQPLRNEAGEITAIVSIGTDVTHSVEARQKIEESERRFRTLANDMPAFMFTADGETNIDFVNRQWLDFVGLSSEEGMGLKWMEVTHPDDVAPMMEVYTHAVHTKQPYQFEIRQRNKEGEYRWVLWRGIPRITPDGGFIGIMGVGTDITEQKRVQEIMRESEERFRQMADLVPQILWTAQPDGYIDYYNKQWYDYTGFVSDRFGDVSWTPVIHPDDLPHLLDNWYTSVQNSMPHNSEFRMKEYSTGQYRWFVGKGVPVRNGEGAIVKWFGSCTDIHEQKTFAENLEQQVAERTRELARSNDDLQQFAHVASHDLKEPVRKVRTFTSRLQHDYGAQLPEPAKIFLQKIENAAIRMGSMIDGVLHYSTVNATQQKPEPVDLTEVLRNVEADLEVVMAQKEARLVYSHLPTVQGMPILLHQLFYNLVNNSLKFAKAAAPPLIQLQWQQQRGSEVAGASLAPARHYAVIVLQDNGIGFAPAEGEKIFSAFTRLNSKDQYEGTGLGLALCKKIVERHGGFIKAEGVTGEGATFTIVLPLEQD